MINAACKEMGLSINDDDITMKMDFRLGRATCQVEIHSLGGGQLNEIE